MVYCHKCGKKNDDDAEYCYKCGNYIAKSSSFEENIEKFAEEFGKKAEQFGKYMEKKAKDFSESIEKTHSEPKRCSKCDVDLSYDAKFCWKCGNEV